MSSLEEGTVDETKPTLPTQAPQQSTKLSISSICGIRQRLVLGVSMITLLLAVLLGLALARPEQQDARNLLAHVMPGTAMKRCRPIDMNHLNRVSLDFVDDLILSTAKSHMSMATAQHFGHQFCVIVHCPSPESCYAMLNPKITNTHTPIGITHEDPLLCSNPTAIQTTRFQNIDVKWFDRKGTVNEQHFEKAESYKLQHMFDTLEGRDVCS